MIKKQLKHTDYSSKESGRNSEQNRYARNKSQGAFESSAKEELENFFTENKADPERLD